jgi:RAI1 like PD-(D/E)XK nuclease
LTLVCANSNLNWPLRRPLIHPSVWDRRPADKSQPINWVELKITQEIESDHDILKFERKLCKFWAQSFLLGVPKIVVGFRSRDGILLRIEELETQRLPAKVKAFGKRSWDGNICVNFTANFLQCKPIHHGGPLLGTFPKPVSSRRARCTPLIGLRAEATHVLDSTVALLPIILHANLLAVLKHTITSEGVWRIRRERQGKHIEVFKIVESGTGEILSDEFLRWRESRLAREVANLLG